MTPVNMKSANMPDADLLGSARRIISSARDRGILLKLVGGLGIYADISSSDEHLNFFRRMDRMSGPGMFADIDFISSSKRHKDIKQLFEGELSFSGDMYVNTVYAAQRNIFHHPEGLFDVDVFYDRMHFSHMIEFVSKDGVGRLSGDSITLPPADLLLTKLQIHTAERKDLVDIAALLLRHQVGAGDDAIDTERVVSVLREDWGFWFDAMNNLRKTIEFVRNENASGGVDEAEAAEIEGKAQRLVSALEDCEKSRKWQKRSRKGTKKIWYNEIEEVVR